MMVEHVLAKQLAEDSLAIYDAGNFEDAVQTFLHGLAGPSDPRRFHDKYYLHLRAVAATRRRDWLEEAFTDIAEKEILN